MLMQTLLRELNSDDPRHRLRAAYILGTIDEVDALDALAMQHRVETDAQSQEAILWAGRRLRPLKESGYTTQEAVFTFYHVFPPPGDSDVSSADEQEQRLIEQLKHDFETDVAIAQTKAARRLVRNAMFLAPPLVAPVLLANSAMSIRAADDPHDLAEALGTSPSVSRERITPTPPANGDIRPYLQRFQIEANDGVRAQIAFDLANVCDNPAALPHLAAAFVRDESEQVRTAAQRAAKMIYWHVVYWEMDRDGRLAEAIKMREGEKLRQEAESPLQLPDPPAKEASPEDIERILREAEIKREQRRRGR